MVTSSKQEELRSAALEYHEFPRAGKLEIHPIKQLTNQRDMALAYSPGVAAACEEIQKDALNAARYSIRGNLVGVITNGTAVLGLGDIGPLAAKPVMEGKAVLFKKFANIDVFDIEIQEKDPDKLIEVIAALEPTFGGINLEDIKAPECFYIERKLRERMNIPVFHDDQHGTAIIVGAALQNGLTLVGKDISNIKLVCSGAGAAALACLKILVELGLRRENIWVCDIEGLVYQGRTQLMDDEKAKFAQPSSLRTLAEVIIDADVFLGLSAGNVLKPEMVASMKAQPIILALANPTPEISPELVKSVRSDAIIATGRSDYPNQVNNVLCFPYIFRGALDCGASTITAQMEIAAVNAIAALARAEGNEVVAAAYAGEQLMFGPEYLIPKPFDPRLMLHIAPAVAQAAELSGVAQRPISDIEVYRDSLRNLVYHSGNFMKPVFAVAKAASSRRIAFAEGEEERILHAAQVIVDENLARPVLIGRPSVVAQRIEKLGLRLKEGLHYEMINTEQDERYRDYWQSYHAMTARKGITIEIAKTEMRRNNTLIAAMMLHKQEIDGMICGTVGKTSEHLQVIDEVIGLHEGNKCYGAMNGLILPGRQVMLVDTHVNYDPSAEQLEEITIMAADELVHFGIIPKIALLSHSNFGSSMAPSACKMREVLTRVKRRRPDLEIEGEMHGDVALDTNLRQSIMPHANLKDSANLLVLPNIDAANIAYNLLKTTAGNNIAIGPILLGAAKPVHILTTSTTVRRIVNMTALTVTDVISGRKVRDSDKPS